MTRKLNRRLKATVGARGRAWHRSRASRGPAAAFCGFYVAKADSKLFNKSSKVVLARDGKTTAITMASDYEGEPKEFAVVIPVPTFIERKQIGVVEMKTIDHLDAFTAPRLVEYHDQRSVRAPRDRWSPRALGQPRCAAARAYSWPTRAISRRHRRGELRRRRIRRLDPVRQRKRRPRQLPQRQRLQDSGRRRGGARQLHQAEDALLRRQGEPRPHAAARQRLSAAAAGALRNARSSCCRCGSAPSMPTARRT